MENIGYLMSDRARLLRRAFDCHVRAAGVTGPQARLLLYMSRVEGKNQGYYADLLDVEPITLTRMIDRMEEAGMVERRRDPADRRAWRLHLTPRSSAIISELNQCIDGLIEGMLAGVSEDERAIFTRVLTVIGTNLGCRRENEVIANG